MSHAPFIIGAYGAAFVALAGLVALSLIDRRRVGSAGPPRKFADRAGG